MRLLLFYLFIGILVLGCKHREKETVVSRKANKNIPAGSSAVSGKQSSSKEAVVVIRQKLGLSGKQINSSRLYSFACEWYGTPYKYAGCQRTGVDCSCFSNILYEKVYNKKLPRSAGEMYTICKKIGLEDVNEGDLVFFKISGNIISHVGVFLKNRHFIHSSTSKGVVISSLDEPYYKKYFYCAGRIRNS